MAIIDTGKLLAPISADAPAGPNLEYDPAFLALERSAAGKIEQVMGKATSAAEPPDWNVVFSQAVALFDRTKDLRVATYLTRALLHKNGLPGFAEGLSLVRRLLETQWATVHPQLDPDDDNDPTMRITALAAFTTPPELLAMRQAPLLISRALGPLSVQDIAPTEGTADTARIHGIFTDSGLPELEACLAGLLSGLADLQGIDAVFEANTGNRGPELAGVQRVFFQARQAVEPRVTERRGDGAAAAALAEAAGTAAGTPVAQARALSGDILSREDAIRAFDKIVVYFQRFEPSSPVPFLIERCKRLISMDFLELLNDLAPEGIKQAQLVVGKPPEPKK